jgi:hypothetical protein
MRLILWARSKIPPNRRVRAWNTPHSQRAIKSSGGPRLRVPRVESMNAKQDLDPTSAAANVRASETATEFEGKVREFLRLGISIRERPLTLPTGHTAAEDVDSLIQRLTVSSAVEIERVISELQAMSAPVAIVSSASPPITQA